MASRQWRSSPRCSAAPRPSRRLRFERARLRFARCPPPRRWWALPEDCTLTPGGVESYSSLSKLCDHPHEWVLHYTARLRAGRAADVSDGPLLYGDLGHRLIEDFFRAHDEWRAVPIRDVLAWVRATYPGLVEREGAVLLEPGRGVDRQRVGATLERAVVRLLAQPSCGRHRARGARSFSRGTVCRTPPDRRHRPVADRRQSAPCRGRREVGEPELPPRPLLVENRALQLATYASLQQTLDAAGRWPHVAFFILSTGNLLANDDARFPDAVVAPSRKRRGCGPISGAASA